MTIYTKLTSEKLSCQFMATKIYHPLMKPIFLLYFLCLWTSPHAAERDSLKPGDTLNSSSSLVSASRRFALRFSQLGNDKSTNVNNLLLGISDCASELIVWHAGKSNVARNSSVLTLDNEGTLKVITRKGGVPIVLYNSSTQPTNNTIATLLDSGNFILKELQSNGSTKRLLWQSFDHPRDTFLPEMKLGVNHKTGKTWSLTSRLADYIPSPGAFSLEWDPKGRELIIRRRGVIYWKSGNRFQNLLPDATSIYEFKVISNGEEEYFSFRDKNQSQQSEWILATTGQLKVIEGPIIARADICYGYNTNGGCQKWKQPKCRDGEELDFSSGYFIKNEDHSTKIANASLSISDCRADCWNNCSCVAYSSLSDNATGCQFWTEMLWFIPGYSRDLFVLKPKTSESRSDSGE